MLLAAFLLFLSYASMVVNPSKGWYMTALGLLFVPIAVLNVILLFWAINRRFRSFLIPLLALLPAAVTVLLSVWYVLRRRSRLSSLRTGGGGKPVYCTAAGLRDYADGPYKELVKPYLRRES